MSSPVVIILAAGKGARFRASGGTTHKLDAPVNGKPVLEHVLDAVHASGLDWHLVQPAGGTDGMGDSIAMGVRATPDATGWLILPADLPLIQPASLRCVADALRDPAVVVPHYQHRPGHPVGFGRIWYAALASLSGASGAKAVVRAARAQGAVMTLPIEDRGVVQDVDTLEDVAVVSALLKKRSV